MFLYYVPGRNGINPGALADLGLGYLHAQSTPCGGVTRGPDDQAGVVFAADSSDTGRVGYWPDRQTWMQIPDSVVWVGFSREHRPTPNSLARPDMIRGHHVTLADGQSWQIPLARSLTGDTALPRKLEWTGAGWTVGGVLARYDDLFRLSLRLWDTLCQADGVEPITFESECDLAAMALGMNYKLGPAEISLLGLLDTHTKSDIVLALVDWPSYQAFVKKKSLADTESGEHGDSD